AALGDKISEDPECRRNKSTSRSSASPRVFSFLRRQSWFVENLAGGVQDLLLVRPRRAPHRKSQKIPPPAKRISSKLDNRGSPLLIGAWRSGGWGVLFERWASGAVRGMSTGPRRHVALLNRSIIEGKKSNVRRSFGYLYSQL